MSGKSNGLVLALEGSTRRASLAGSFRGRIHAQDLDPDRSHQSDLLPAIDALVRQIHARPVDLSAVIVGTGPGSYTGLRVAIATALGLARAAGSRLLGVPSGEALCLEACADGEELALLLDARAGELYFGRWRRVGAEVEASAPLRVLAVRDAPGLDLALARIVTDATEHVPASARSRIVQGARPRARSLLELGLARLARGLETPPERLEPLYLRPFAATARNR